MPDFTQLPLPGFPIRIIVSALWEDAARPCTVRATLDAPSDEFTSQMVGADTAGMMTWEELEAAMQTLLSHVMDNAAPPFAPRQPLPSLD